MLRNINFNVDNTEAGVRFPHLQLLWLQPLSHPVYLEQHHGEHVELQGTSCAF